MNKLLRSRKFQIISAVIILLIVVLLSADRFSKVNIVRNIVTAPVTFVQKGINTVGDWLEGVFSSVRNYRIVVEENADLKDENLERKEHIASLSGLEEENNRLREAVKLKNRFDNYEIIGANIVGSDPGNFLYNYRIDIGSLDGVEIDDPVIASNNVLVGRIYSIGLTSSVVMPLIDELSGISAWTIKSEGGHAIVKGDIEYKADGLCLMDTINETMEMKIGDILETSGMGGIFPKGILIGEIIEVHKATSVIGRHATIRPFIDFNAIEEVYILKEKDTGEN
ncbi:MAG: rod shape-determining protein MreC [Clostridiales bacterium]|nr:rod shape-determining protein MreC [Clostridiales bacterium]